MSTVRKVRVLIADSHKFVADACKQLLEPLYEVVDIAIDGHTVLQSALKLKPDVAVLEISLPQLNGLEVAELIHRKVSRTKIVFLTAHTDAKLAAEAFRRGTAAYVLKQSGAEEFLTAIKRVMRGESYLSPLITRETIEYLQRPQKQTVSNQHITSREAEILELLAEGRPMKEDARILEITSSTVAFHKYKMMERLGISTNAALLVRNEALHDTCRG